MKKFKPFKDRILVRRIEEAETKRNGIYIPDTAKEKPQQGIVVAVGRGRYEKGILIPLEAKQGSHVLFGKHSGSEVKIGGELLLAMQEDEIIGAFED